MIRVEIREIFGTFDDLYVIDAVYLNTHATYIMVLVSSF